jgi:hypothetical protein
MRALIAGGLRKLALKRPTFCAVVALASLLCPDRAPGQTLYVPAKPLPYSGSPVIVYTTPPLPSVYVGPGYTDMTGATPAPLIPIPPAQPAPGYTAPVAMATASSFSVVGKDVTMTIQYDSQFNPYGGPFQVGNGRQKQGKDFLDRIVITPNSSSAPDWIEVTFKVTQIGPPGIFPLSPAPPIIVPLAQGRYVIDSAMLDAFAWEYIDWVNSVQGHKVPLEQKDPVKVLVRPRVAGYTAVGEGEEAGTFAIKFP